MISSFTEWFSAAVPAFIPGVLCLVVMYFSSDNTLREFVWVVVIIGTISAYVVMLTNPCDVIGRIDQNFPYSGFYTDTEIKSIKGEAFDRGKKSARPSQPQQALDAEEDIRDYPGAQGWVYVTQDMNYFHTTKNCNAITDDDVVIKIPDSHAGNIQPCSDCAYLYWE